MWIMTCDTAVYINNIYVDANVTISFLLIAKQFFYEWNEFSWIAFKTKDSCSKVLSCSNWFVWPNDQSSSKLEIICSFYSISLFSSFVNYRKACVIFKICIMRVMALHFMRTNFFFYILFCVILVCYRHKHTSFDDKSKGCLSYSGYINQIQNYW